MKIAKLLLVVFTTSILPINVFSARIYHPGSEQTNMIGSTEQKHENLVEIVGHIFDSESKQPLAGAIVMVDGVNVGTSTDSNGNFMMFVKPGMKFHISAKGFHPAIVIVEKDMNNLAVYMKRDTDTKATPVVEEQASFPGGFPAMLEFLSKNLNYPEKAALNGIQGKVFVECTIDVDGTIVDVNVVQSVNPDLDKEAIRVIKLMPKWKPAKQNGKLVRIKTTIPINFKLTDSNTDTNPVTEEQASFPGGLAACADFLSKNLNYPKSAAKDGIQGRVYVEFVVDIDGSVVDVKILRSVNPDLDKEAIRIVKSMPKWNPGKINGQPVRTRGTIPINFKLTK